MDTVIRVTYVFVLLLIALRVIGKREMSQLSPFDLLILLLVPELFQQALVRDDFSMTTATIAAATLFSLTWLTSVLTYLSRRGRILVEGEPTVLLHNGKLVLQNLDRERVTEHDILSEARTVGVERLEHIKWAILETDGKIAIIPKPRARSVRRPIEKPKM